MSQLLQGLLWFAITSTLSGLPNHIIQTPSFLLHNLKTEVWKKFTSETFLANTSHYNSTHAENLYTAELQAVYNHRAIDPALNIISLKLLYFASERRTERHWRKIDIDINFANYKSYGNLLLRYVGKEASKSCALQIWCVLISGNQYDEWWWKMLKRCFTLLFFACLFKIPL